MKSLRLQASCSPQKVLSEGRKVILPRMTRISHHRPLSFKGDLFKVTWPGDSSATSFTQAATVDLFLSLNNFSEPSPLTQGGLWMALGQVQVYALLLVS